MFLQRYDVLLCLLDLQKCICVELMYAYTSDAEHILSLHELIFVSD